MPSPPGFYSYPGTCGFIDLTYSNADAAFRGTPFESTLKYIQPTLKKLFRASENRVLAGYPMVSYEKASEAKPLPSNYHLCTIK
jgi:hypothetical protein